jgi:hypothetical protein
MKRITFALLLGTTFALLMFFLYPLGVVMYNHQVPTASQTHYSPILNLVGSIITGLLSGVGAYYSGALGLEDNKVKSNSDNKKQTEIK